MSDFRERVVNVALEEWDWFGRAERDVAGRLLRRGALEHTSPHRERIGLYFAQGANRPGVDGDDGIPWSAAFVCWVMRQAGAGLQFPRSAGHATYIRRAWAARTEPTAPFVAHPPNDYAPRVGDIVAYARSDEPLDLGNLPRWFSSHGDIVVDVEDDALVVVGGNVSNTVLRRRFRTQDGHLAAGRLPWLAVIETRMEWPVEGETPDVFHRVTARSGLRLRAGPGTGFDVLRVLPFDTQVAILREEEKWRGVDLQGDGRVDGFVHGAFLDRRA